MTTIRELIKSSLRLLGVIEHSENAPADIMLDSLTALNRMLDLWRRKGVVYNKTQATTFSTVINQAIYNLDDLNLNKDVSIYKLSYFTTNAKECIISERYLDQFLNIKSFNLGATAPVVYYKEHNKIEIYPKPDAAYNMVLVTDDSSMSYTSLDDELNAPAGWNAAITFNLAKELALEFNRDVKPVLEEKAREYLTIITPTEQLISNMSINKDWLQNGNRNYLWR